MRWPWRRWKLTHRWGYVDAIASIWTQRYLSLLLKVCQFDSASKFNCLCGSKQHGTTTSSYSKRKLEELIPFRPGLEQLKYNWAVEKLILKLVRWGYKERLSTHGLCAPLCTADQVHREIWGSEGALGFIAKGSCDEHSRPWGRN